MFHATYPAQALVLFLALPNIVMWKTAVNHPSRVHFKEAELASAAGKCCQCCADQICTHRNLPCWHRAFRQQGASSLCLWINLSSKNTARTGGVSDGCAVELFMSLSAILQDMLPGVGCALALSPHFPSSSPHCPPPPPREAPISRIIACFWSRPPPRTLRFCSTQACILLVLWQYSQISQCTMASMPRTSVMHSLQGKPPLHDRCMDDDALFCPTGGPDVFGMRLQDARSTRLAVVTR